MLRSLRLVHYLRFFSVVLVLLWIYVEFGRDDDGHHRYTDVIRQFRNQRTVFVNDFLTHDIGKGFKGEGISALCASKTWTPGLILTCDAVPGSVTDVKNGILTCVRIGIEMGAEIILPEIMLRSTTDLSNIAPHDVGPRRGVPLDRFYDREHLTSQLREFCPELKIHASLDEFADEPGLASPVGLDVYKVPGVVVEGNRHGSDGRIIHNADELGKLIHAYLDQRSPPRSRRYPFRVSLRPTPPFALPAFADPPALRTYFGRLLRARADLRALAAAVLFNLQAVLGLPLDPRQGIDIDAFVGVELRTQRDPRPFDSYVVQASDALGYVVNNNMSRVYLTEGATADNATAFAARCVDYGVRVVAKDDLVDGADAAALARLSYDERFLVDYEVVLRAGLFVGSAQSGFAWNVALRRELAFGDAGASNASHLNGTVRWHNQYSTLYGKGAVGDELRRAIWP